MENTEKNRLIGNFMEWKNIPPITTEEGSLTFCNGFEFLDKTKFHCSWDWLMPVVEKIEEFNLTVDIQNIPGLGQYCRIYSAGADVVPVRNYDSKIKAVYNAAVQFITWHNEIK